MKTQNNQNNIKETTNIAKHSRNSKNRLYSAKTPSSKVKIQYTLTPEEIYNLSTRKCPWGIEGYEVPVLHYCDHEEMWKKKRAKILNDHKHIWPPLDWPRDKEDDKVRHPPKRPNYLDDLFKWCNSYYDPQRAKDLIEEQNIDVKEYKKPLYIDKRKRKDFLANEKKKEEWKKSRPEFPEYKTEAIEDIQQKIKEQEKDKNITYEQKMKNKYRERPATSRCDRVTVVADAEYVGEQLPFYNTYHSEKDEKKDLFFPDKKLCWKRAPAWKYPRPKTSKEAIKARDDLLNEKVENYLNEKGLTKKDLLIDVRKAFHQVTHHGENLHRIVPRFKYENEEQYQTYKENNPFTSIGPQQYWKLPKEKPGKKNKSNYEVIEDDKGNKIYYMDRRKTDKRVYNPNLRKAVY